MQTKNETQKLPGFLQRAYLQGAEFFVDGEEVRAEDALARMVREDDYMADYICDAHGRIAQIRFDKVMKD